MKLRQSGRAAVLVIASCTWITACGDDDGGGGGTRGSGAGAHSGGAGGGKVLQGGSSNGGSYLGGSGPIAGAGGVGGADSSSGGAAGAAGSGGSSGSHSEGGSVAGGESGAGGAAGTDGTAGSAAIVWDGTLPAKGVCSPEGWCWLYPSLPDFEFDLVSSGPGNTWAVGKRGILQFDGSAWRGVTGSDLADLVGSSGPTDTWIVNNSRHEARHWDGESFSSPVALPTQRNIRRIWVRASNDAWMVGEWGTVLRWNGSAWAPVDAGFDSTFDLTSVHGTSASDVWIGAIARGTGATLRHSSGGAFVDSGYSGNVTDVWAHSATDVWIAGAGAMHWNGAAWQNVTSKPPLFSGALRVMGSPTGSEVLLASGGQRVFSATASESGVTVTSGPVSPLAEDISPRAVLAYDSDFVLSLGVCGSSCAAVPRSVTLVRRSGGEFIPYEQGPGGSANPGANHLVPLGSDDDVLLLAGKGLFRGTAGGALSLLNGACAPAVAGDLSSRPRCNGVAVDDLAASSVSDIWTTASGTTQHWNGTGWVTWPLAPQLLIATSTAAWALDDKSRINRFTPDGWQPEATVPATTNLVRGFGDELWAVVAADGSLRHYTGSSWSTVPSAPVSLGYLQCTESSEAGSLAVYLTDSVASFDGTDWTVRAITGGGVHGCAMHAGRGWGVKDAQTIAYFDGSAWIAYPNPNDGEPRFVVGPGGRTWALYSDDQVLEWRPR